MRYTPPSATAACPPRRRWPASRRSCSASFGTTSTRRSRRCSRPLWPRETPSSPPLPRCPPPRAKSPATPPTAFWWRGWTTAPSSSPSAAPPSLETRWWALSPGAMAYPSTAKTAPTPTPCAASRRRQAAGWPCPGWRAIRSTTAPPWRSPPRTGTAWPWTWPWPCPPRR